MIWGRSYHQWVVLTTKVEWWRHFSFFADCSINEFVVSKIYTGHATKLMTWEIFTAYLEYFNSSDHRRIWSAFITHFIAKFIVCYSSISTFKILPLSKRIMVTLYHSFHFNLSTRFIRYVLHYELIEENILARSQK